MVEGFVEVLHKAGGGGGHDEFHQPFVLDVRNIAALIVGFMVSALALAAGVGGGAFFVPLFNVVVGMSIKAASSTSQAAVFGGSLASCLFNLRVPAPGDAARCIIDFHLALVLIPALLVGVDLGVLVNPTLPNWLIAALLVALLGFMCKRTADKGRGMWRKESAAKARSTGSLPSLADGASALDLQTYSQRAQRIRYPKGVMAEVLLLWGVFLSLALLRRQYGRCSVGFAAVMAGEVALCGASAVLFIRQVVSHHGPSDDEEEGHAGAAEPLLNNNNSDDDGDENGGGAIHLEASTRVLATSAAGIFFASMIAGILGLGGGMLFTPMLLEYGINPQVATATANLLILFSSSSATAAWALSGRLNLQYAGVYFATCVVGALAGRFVIGGYVKRSGRASLLVLLLAGIMAGGAALTGAFGAWDAWRQWQAGAIDWFHSWCG